MSEAVLSAILPDRATETVCLHCGESCGKAVVFTNGRPFCCSGCASVFTVLRSRGLEGFYACDVAPGVSQRHHHDDDFDRFGILDDPETASAFVVALGDGHARAILRVPDLHCASCVWLLEQLWRIEPGVARSEVNLVGKTVRIDFDPATTSLRRIAEALSSVGYQPSLDRALPRAAETDRRRSLLLKIGVAGFAFGNVMLFSVPEYLSGRPVEPPFRQTFDALNVVLSIVVLLYSASDYFRSAWRAVTHRAITLEVPVALGLAVMFVRSVSDVVRGTGTGFFDSFTGLVLFLLVGKLFQEKAFDRIAFDRDVRSFLPLFARLVRDGIVVARPIQEIAPGDTIHVRPREVVPADALLDEERGVIDLTFITGESAPIPVRRGDIVRAGAKVKDRSLRLVVVRPASASTLTELWTHPVFDTSRVHWLTTIADRFGAWFTVAACGLAVAGAALWWPDVDMAVQVATAVLIIACPCALTLAAPITLGTAMGVLGRLGCFLKSPAVLLDLSRVDHVVFDKTGTLTTGSEHFSVQREGLTSVEWRQVIALASHSVHPISRAIAISAPGDTSRPVVTGILETAGEGITGDVDGRTVAIGRRGFVEAVTGTSIAPVPGWTWVSVGEHVGRLRLNAVARLGIEAMLQRLGRRHPLSLVSGDHRSYVEPWRPWFEDVRADQSPSNKLTAIQRARETGRHVLMVGDGLNDAGALAAAEVGMAVSDDTACLVPSCDAVIRGDRLSTLDAILSYARRARSVIWLCFIVSVVYNVLGLTLALRGELTPLVTAVLMPVSSISIVALGAGLMRWRPPQERTA